MSLRILSAQHTAALENRLVAHGVSLNSLMSEAIQGCFSFIQSHFPKHKYTSAAVLVGSGHNGADALGIGSELLREGRQVIAVLAAPKNTFKAQTQLHLDAFTASGGLVFECENDAGILQLEKASAVLGAEFWIDGLFGFGLNRPAVQHAARLIEWVNNLSKQVVSIDIPSGLSCDYGRLDGAYIRATHTLALGVLKPAHVDDSALDALGQVHCIPMSTSNATQRISAPDWSSPEQFDLLALLNAARRPVASHKISNGRVLAVVGSKLYPGAGILACLGAQVSGAGMIHALMPQSAHSALLARMPEVIFEKRLPALENFDAIVLGSGWVPGDELIFQKVLDHVLRHSHPKLILDAGAFRFLKKLLSQGQSLSSQFILTPHMGEFERLFPEAKARLRASNSTQRLNRLEAASWAAQLSGAIVLLKGARSHIAHPNGEVSSLLHSSPLLAHAGHGDVLAGLIAGLAARGLESKKAALLAALLQSQTAREFSSQHPAALTLPPAELVQRLHQLHHL